MLTEGRTTINSEAPGAEYGWLVYESYIESGNFGQAQPVEVTGPRGISDENHDKLKAGEGSEFELYDDDGVLYYKGRLIGDDVTGFEPLEDYGTPNAGAVNMKLDGSWL